jgi:hypothetical protein
MRRLFFIGLCLPFASAAIADDKLYWLLWEQQQTQRAQAARQPQRYPGAEALGSAIAHGQNARQQQQYQRAQEEAAAAARRDELRHEYEEREQVNALRTALASEWKGFGLADDEAAAVANVYTYQFEQQDAVEKRIMREGWKSGVEQALAAYKAYNYQLANTLLLASRMALHEEQQAQAQQSAK